MERILLQPDQLIVPGEYELGNESILKIYFRLFDKGHGEDLPPAIVTANYFDLSNLDCTREYQREAERINKKVEESDPIRRKNGFERWKQDYKNEMGKFLIGIGIPKADVESLYDRYLSPVVGIRNKITPASTESWIKQYNMELEPRRKKFANAVDKLLKKYGIKLSKDGDRYKTYYINYWPGGGNTTELFGESGDIKAHIVRKEALQEAEKNMECNRRSFGRKVAPLGSKIQELSQSSLGPTYLLLDGNHKSAAATLTHNLIPSLELQMDDDLAKIRKMAESGELFGFERPEETLKELTAGFYDFCMHRVENLDSVQNRVDGLVSEGRLPQYMIERYMNGKQ